MNFMCDCEEFALVGMHSIACSSLEELFWAHEDLDVDSEELDEFAIWH